MFVSFRHRRPGVSRIFCASLTVSMLAAGFMECVQFTSSPGNASFCTAPGQESKNTINTKI